MEQENSIKIYHSIYYKIITNGYTDRYLSANSFISAHVTKEGLSVIHRYNNMEELFKGLQQIFSWNLNTIEEYMEKHKEIKKQEIISLHIKGRSDRHTYTDCIITDEDVKSIEAYILLYREEKIAKKYLESLNSSKGLEESREQLKAYPLKPVIENIVKYQLKKCNDHNKEVKGHPYGTKYIECDKFLEMPANELPLYIDYDFKSDTAKNIFKKRLSGEIK